MSQSVNEQVNAGMVAAADERKPSAGGYRALAVIAFIIAVGGLFLGLLSKWTDIFTHWMYTASEGAALSGSLIDYLIEYTKNIFDVGVWTYVKSLFSNPFNVAGLSQLLSALMVAVAVVVSLVTLIVSFCSRKAAKNCAMTSLVCVLLGYGGLFAYAFFTARVLLGGNGFSRMMFDIPTAIVAGVALICLVIAALARRKGMGLLDLILFLLTALCIYSLCNSRSAMVLLMATNIKEELFFAISAIALFALVALTFLATSIRLTAKKAYVFDAVRYGLLLAAAVCTVISYGLMLEWSNFKDDLLNSILLLAAPLAAFLLSIVIAIAQASSARKKEAEEASSAIGAVADRAPAPAPVAALPAPAAAAPANAVVSEGSQDVAKNVTVNVQPKPAEAQTPQNVTVNVTPAMYGQQPMMPFYPMPYYSAPAAQQPAAAQAEPAPAPAPAPAPQTQKESPMSEFERSMAALAKGIEPEPAPDSATAASTTYQSTPAPVFAQPQPAPAPVPTYDASQYTYDSFINSLTPQEKNEFGDLFIANKYGDLSYLPGYVIGGDNREFFSKVFIYFGRFRGHISSSLLDKLYNYVCRN